MSKPKRNFMPRTLHTKFVDDLFLAESLNLKDSLAINPLRQLPDNYHSRFGMKLSPEKSQVCKELVNTLNFANNNDKKSHSKTFDSKLDAQIWLSKIENGVLKEVK